MTSFFTSTPYSPIPSFLKNTDYQPYQSCQPQIYQCLFNLGKLRLFEIKLRMFPVMEGEELNEIEKLVLFLRQAWLTEKMVKRDLGKETRSEQIAFAKEGKRRLEVYFEELEEERKEKERKQEIRREQIRKECERLRVEMRERERVEEEKKQEELREMERIAQEKKEKERLRKKKQKKKKMHEEQTQQELIEYLIAYKKFQWERCRARNQPIDFTIPHCAMLFGGMRPNEMMPGNGATRFEKYEIEPGLTNRERFQNYMNRVQRERRAIKIAEERLLDSVDSFEDIRLMLEHVRKAAEKQISKADPKVVYQKLELQMDQEAKDRYESIRAKHRSFTSEEEKQLEEEQIKLLNQMLKIREIKVQKNENNNYTTTNQTPSKDKPTNPKEHKLANTTEDTKVETQPFPPIPEIATLKKKKKPEKQKPEKIAKSNQSDLDLLKMPEDKAFLKILLKPKLTSEEMMEYLRESEMFRS